MLGVEEEVINVEEGEQEDCVIEEENVSHMELLMNAIRS